MMWSILWKNTIPQSRLKKQEDEYFNIHQKILFIKDLSLKRVAGLDRIKIRAFKHYYIYMTPYCIREYFREFILSKKKNPFNTAF